LVQSSCNYPCFANSFPDTDRFAGFIYSDLIRYNSHFTSISRGTDLRVTTSSVSDFSDAYSHSRARGTSVNLNDGLTWRA